MFYYRTINSKWIKNLNIRPETIKLTPGENIDSKFSLHWAPITQIIKLKYFLDRRGDDPSLGNLTNSKKNVRSSMT